LELVAGGGRTIGALRRSSCCDRRTIEVTAPPSRPYATRAKLAFATALNADMGRFNQTALKAS